jgi:hypothetical protein
MDQRLKDVHQTDLTESRINEDFVDWLKTKGPQWLLLIMIGVAGYLNEAWAALLDCRLPGSFEDVAMKYSEVRGLPQQALNMGGDVLLNAVAAERPLGADTNPTAQTPPAEITEEERTDYLARAERFYQAVADSDDGSLGLTLHAVDALQGLAVVAESRGDVDDARRGYELAAGRAADFYPQLAERIRGRAGNVEQYAVAVHLPAQADLPARPPQPDLQPAVLDAPLRELLLPEQSDG